ncbi:MAG: hypothetical protein EP330_01225 [Deltaproteobacteria bacterium]|nr:MAG: hypothetical protein EP330_01225 [Deltaproteobacteria bacterium]
MSKTLYSTPDNTRFFHVPDQAKLPEGDVVLRSLRGRTLRVNENSVSTFEVSEERAKELAAVEMEAIARQARELMTGAGSFLRGLAAGMTQPPAPPADRPERRQTIADALGVTPEQLTSDPQAVLEGLKNIGAGLKKAMEDGLEQAPSARTRERQEAVVAKLQELLGEDGVPSADELPGKLRELLGTDELEAGLRKAAADLKAASQRLRETTPRRSED